MQCLPGHLKFTMHLDALFWRTREVDRDFAAVTVAVEVFGLKVRGHHPSGQHRTEVERDEIWDYVPPTLIVDAFSFSTSLIEGMIQ